MYKLFLCLRYLRKRRIAFFAVIAVCLCVAMVLIVVSVMGGFLQMVKDRSRGMLGDLIVENGALQGFPYYEDLIDEIKTKFSDRVTEATPVIISYGVLRFPEDQITKPVQIVGIRLGETYRVNDFKSGLFYETYYPGTTTFAEQGEPRYGLNAEGEFLLPGDLEAARREWQSKVPKTDVNDAWRATRRLFVRQGNPYKRALNRGEIPPELRAEFNRHDHPLPPGATVEQAERGRKWVIRGGEGLIVLEAVEGRLIISHAQYTGPGFYLPIPVTEENHSTLAPFYMEPKLPGIIIGTDICAKRKSSGGYDRYYHRGSKVQLTFVPITETGRLTDATGMPSKLFRYTDDSRTGVYDIDSTSVYVDFDLAQQILRMDRQQLSEESGGGFVPPRSTQIQIKLKPGVDPHVVRDEIQQVWSRIRDRHIADSRAPELIERVSVVTWEEKQAKFIGAVENEKILVTTLFGVISVVAVFLVGCIFYMIVQQKTRDIGIVKSVGATSMGVANIFLSYGAAVGVVGGAIGVVLGAVFVWYINDIQDVLRAINPSLQVWNPEVYAFDRIPNTVVMWDVVWIYIVAIIASMVGSLIAAWRAARIWPVEALRYE